MEHGTIGSFAVAVVGLVLFAVARSRRLHGSINRWRLDRERKTRTLVVDDAGVELRDTRRGVQRWSLRWEDVAEIVAFKHDRFVVDDVCIGLRPMGSDRWFVCDEDMPGWDQLNVELGRRFGIVREAWWPVVEPVAFARNWTVLWKGGV